MITPAFSTVACPTLTLMQVADLAASAGYLAIELRTFGVGSRRFACDPALSDPSKVRRIFESRGVRIAGIATGESFDQRVFPPVMGNVFNDYEGPVRAAKRAIDLAVSVEAPLVRVFAFEAAPGEPLAKASRRIVDRIKKVVDHADRTGVKVMIENGGSWNTAAELRSLVEQVGSPLLGACYHAAVGHAAGDTPDAAARLLGGSLLAVRLSDWKDGRPVHLGHGGVPCRAVVERLHSAGWSGPAIVEWDRAWISELNPADRVLPEAARTVFSWIGGAAHTGAPHAAAASAH